MFAYCCVSSQIATLMKTAVEGADPGTGLYCSSHPNLGKGPQLTVAFATQMAC